MAGPKPVSVGSAGIVVLLSLEEMTGQVVDRYVQPDGKFGIMFGSVHFLSNGDRFIGCGGQRSISQYTKSNDLVFHTELADNAMPAFNYRAFKGAWVGSPKTKPDLFSCSWTCTWRTTMQWRNRGEVMKVLRWRICIGSFRAGGSH